MVGVKTRRHEFGEFIEVKQQEGGPLAALSPLEEKGVTTGEVEKKPRPASIKSPWLRLAATEEGTSENRRWLPPRKVKLAQPRDNLEREQAQD